MGEEYIRLKEMTFDVNVASANADSPFGVVPPAQLGWPALWRLVKQAGKEQAGFWF